LSGESDAAAVWNAAGDASAAWIGSTGGNVLSADGDSSAIFVGAELAAAVLAAAGDSSAAFISLAVAPEEQPQTVGGRGRRRRGPKRDDVSVDDVLKNWEERERILAKDRAKAAKPGRTPKPELEQPIAEQPGGEPIAPAPATTARPAVPVRSPHEVVIERLKEQLAASDQMRVELQAQLEEAEIFAVVALAALADDGD
jgi:hypothetical protein